MWIVSQGADYEGCFEHIGPFDTEDEARKFAERCQDQKRVYKYWYWELEPPEVHLDKNNLR